MTITHTTPIADIATAIPSSVRVFARHGIDFCCGGKRPLKDVCEQQGLSFAAIVQAVEAGATTAASGRDWTSVPPGELIDHILTTYHVPLREELPRLASMAAKVLKVHGRRDPVLLTRVNEITEELHQDLFAHMSKEEQVLFPAIRQRETGGGSGIPLETPIGVMEQEHDRAGALLAELNRLTSGYQVPDWACATATALFHGLSDLERDMHVHVHLENNVLFPRVLQPAGAA